MIELINVNTLCVQLVFLGGGCEVGRSGPIISPVKKKEAYWLTIHICGHVLLWMHLDVRTKSLICCPCLFFSLYQSMTFMKQIINFAKYSFICNLYGSIKDDAWERQKGGGINGVKRCMEQVVRDVICNEPAPDKGRIFIQIIIC